MMTENRLDEMLKQLAVQAEQSRHAYQEGLEIARLAKIGLRVLREAEPERYPSDALYSKGHGTACDANSQYCGPGSLNDNR